MKFFINSSIFESRYEVKKFLYMVCLDPVEILFRFLKFYKSLDPVELLFRFLKFYKVVRVVERLGVLECQVN